MAIHQEINDLLGGGDTSVDISLGGLGTHLFRGAEITTAEANINAGIAAAKQIVDFLVNGNEKYRVNK